MRLYQCKKSSDENLIHDLIVNKALVKKTINHDYDIYVINEVIKIIFFAIMNFS